MTEQLRTNFKDDILAESMEGRRRYQMVQNGDGTVSFVDATEYDQVGSDFGQAELNATNQAILDLQNEQLETADPMTATEEGLAADAKLTGEAIRDLSANLYPVGSIYMSVNDTNPTLLFGGIWERMLDRFLLGASGTYAAGTTGGEKTHKLTIDEIPSHSHYYTYLSTAASTRDTSAGSQMGDRANARTTAATGGSKEHNNMPPYLAVYMWKRVA